MQVMQFKPKRILLLLIVSVLIAPLLFTANLIHIRIRVHHLAEVDHVRILSACREAILKRDFYHSYNGKWMTLGKGDVLLLPPFPDDIPAAIRELGPREIIIHTDYIMIDISLPFSRISLLGFKPGVKQFGSYKYIDGLWFWNGNKEQAGSPK